jgi:hypothetical protein
LPLPGGRIGFGTRFANTTVLVEEIDEPKFRIINTRTIPAHELRPHRNR